MADRTERPNLEHDEISADLPWYITGALDETRKREIEAYLASSPAAREELATERRLRDGLLARDDFEGADDQTWERLKEAIAAETPTPAPSRVPDQRDATAAQGGSILPDLSWLLDWLDRWRFPVAGTAIGAAALVIGLSLPTQDAGIIPAGDPAPYQTLTTPDEIKGPSLRVKAAADADPKVILALFAELGLTVADAPSPGGVYLLTTAEDADLGAAASILSNAPEIAFVVVRTGR
ncbi:MAG: hypothetical protein AAGI13_04045 [Pseudomonadota bacterium]